MYVVVAKWVAKPGEEDNVLRILETMTPLTRAEPGCRVYVAHRSLEEPRTFLLYEQYDDEEAFKAHGATEHFKVHVLRDAVPRLETRERALYQDLG